MNNEKKYIINRVKINNIKKEKFMNKIGFVFKSNIIAGNNISNDNTNKIENNIKKNLTKYMPIRKKQESL